MQQRKHIIATTGTGSGKTECFLLPVIADLINESQNWKQTRTRAVRTLILYPLNALAEDQMIRLRKSLNSDEARNWLNNNRGGHRFYFGRYTGKTDTSGLKTDSRKQANRIKKDEHITAWKAAKEAHAQAPERGLIYHVTNMEPDTAELWDRWTMQETPPDILITNYSMLNIMLFRKQEKTIFQQTRQWLDEDENNIFHLVIDEMHTYRGTAGTEVAYLLRLLLDKLGRHPNHKQIQFLASSASMQENEKTEEYLTSFFGVEKTTTPKNSDYSPIHPTHP
ncbi:MAG: DEAD/DEAH box helicase [Tannerellaceae bacterium]|nr:DEAD/DEAH box helicase [Tannerellaceae bacterium]